MDDKANVANSGNGRSETLHAAAREGRVDEVKVLLANGANRDEIDPETGLTARQAAAARSAEGYKEVIRLLSDGPEDDSRSFVGCEVAAYHEAGHPVAYYELGYAGLFFVSIDRGGPVAQPDESGATSRMGGIALYSGPAAHAKHLARPLDERFLSLVGTGDMASIDHHAAQEASRSGRAIIAIKQKWRQDAVTLIDRCWPKVRRLALGLLKVPTIHGRAAVALMNGDVRPEPDDIEMIHNDGQGKMWSRSRT